MPRPQPDVDALLDARAHPLRAQIDDLRAVIRGVDPAITEQWKWNAPSFSVRGEYLVTFMLRDDDRVLLVVHHPAAPDVASPLLGGDYDDGRRMITLHEPGFESARAEIERVIRELVARTAVS